MRNYSSRFKLPNGKWAYIQLDELAEDAKRHIAQIRRLWKPPEYFFHLRSGGHIAALRRHQANTWYAKVDLSSFFYNVSRHRLTRCLKRIGYSFRDAEDFAVASTVCVSRASRRFGLPYGFVQSPLLASIALDKSELGNCFRRLDSAGSTLSVYVDDIIVSSNDKSDVASAFSQIFLSARKSQFPINTGKCQSPSISLRAFNIDLDEHAMEIAQDRYEELCRKVLACGAGQVSQGILSYVRSVSTPQAERIVGAFPRSFPDNDQSA